MTDTATDRQAGSHAVPEVPAPLGQPELRPGWFDSARPSRYLPALDGLRALAVASVFAYHLGFRWAGGGFLGVDIFFVVSGYLITSLLLSRSRRGAGSELASFWGRRARRLLPALFLMLAVTSLAAYLDRSHVSLSAFRSDALATLAYVANWHEIVAHQSYFAQFAVPSPLEHTWSLAIEEQFYLFWPLLVAGCLALAARRVQRHGGVLVAAPKPVANVLAAARKPVGLVAGALAVSSATTMALAYHGQADTTAVYFATDTRAFELLVGACLAVILLDRPTIAPARRAYLDTAGFLGLGGIAVVWSYASGPAPWMYRGGFLAATLFAAIVIAAVARPEPGPLGRILGLRPIRYLGRISYGIYLWHWPVIVFLTPDTVGTTGVTLDLLRVSVTLALSVASFHLVERPLRRASYRGAVRRSLLPAGILLTTGAIVMATLGTPALSPAASTPISSRNGDLPAEVAGGPFPYEPAPIVLHPESGYSPSNPLRIMVIGDSVMWTGEPALAAALDSTGDARVSNAAFVGWGLTTAKNWRTQIPALIKENRPRLIVGTWSWDDPEALAHPTQYRKLLDAFVKVLLTQGNGVQAVVLFQFPPLGPLWSIDPNAASQDPKRFAGVSAWNRAAASVAERHAGRVMFLKVAQSVEVKGKFSAWLPDGNGGWARARMVDNTHFCPWGASVYAASIADSLDPLLHLPAPVGDWWNAAWISDPRYAQANGFPGGACPDDQPPASDR